MVGDGFFDVVVEDEGDQVVIRVSGEVDRNARDTLWEAVQGARRRSRRLVFDMSGTTFIDGCGVNVLLRACREQGGPPGSVAIRAPSAPVRRVLTLVGIDGFVLVQTASETPESPGRSAEKPSAGGSIDEALGDVTELDVLALGGPAQQVEGGLGVDALLAHEDALGLLDDGSAGKGGLEVLGKAACLPEEVGVGEQDGGRLGEAHPFRLVGGRERPQAAAVEVEGTDAVPADDER